MMDELFIMVSRFGLEATTEIRQRRVLLPTHFPLLNEIGVNRGGSKRRLKVKMKEQGKRPGFKKQYSQ
jgi:hypothetical protein